MFMPGDWVKTITHVHTMNGLYVRRGKVPESN